MLIVINSKKGAPMLAPGSHDVVTVGFQSTPQTPVCELVFDSVADAVKHVDKLLDKDATYAQSVLSFLNSK